MTAYVVITRERLRDQAEMDTYSKMDHGKSHAPKPLAVYGKYEMLEGAAIEGAILLEFPDMDAAKAWYDSPEYSEARKHRWLGADYRIFIVEGM